MALCLLNGEIFRNDETVLQSQESPDSLDMLDCTVEELIRKFLLEFNPPGTEYRLSPVKHFRFTHVSLTQHGIETSGWLWELGEVITFEQCNHDEIERKVKTCKKNPWNGKGVLHPVWKCILWILVKKLNGKRYGDFADYLVDYMDEDEDEGGIVSPSEPFIDKMIEAVVQGVLDDRPLRLARRYDATQPSAIFVSPSKEIRDHNPPLAFTSWANGGGAELPKFVSLEVCHDGTSIQGAKRLYTRSWINGIWDARRCRMDRFIFP
jgi:hypothetical protein